jgi:hypothetical protein
MAIAGHTSVLALQGMTTIWPNEFGRDGGAHQNRLHAVEEHKPDSAIRPTPGARRLSRAYRRRERGFPNQHPGSRSRRASETGSPPRLAGMPTGICPSPTWRLPCEQSVHDAGRQYQGGPSIG